MNTKSSQQKNSSQKKHSVLLIQPKMGMLGQFSQHPPLSLLYVAAGLSALPIEVKIIDARVAIENIFEQLKKLLDSNVLFVGITVMAGFPAEYSLKISEHIKKINKNIPVVWGGALPTISPSLCLENDAIDYIVSGSGVSSVELFASALIEADTANMQRLKKIPGLGFKLADKKYYNPRYKGFEHVHYKKLPYDLIPDFSLYGQIGSKNRIFPIYSVYGCPYSCAFCVSPYLYRDFPKKWEPIEINEVIEHILFLKNNYNAECIYFYDDDSFVNLEHIKKIIDRIRELKINISLSFRGARVNEVLKMDEHFIQNLTDTGTKMLHIGVESGCQRILDLFKKNITVDEILQINEKLSKHPQIIAAYNWIVGTPTETIDEIMQTTRLLYRLIKTNPNCFVFQPNVFRTIQGTELSKLASKMGYVEPTELKGCFDEETKKEYFPPWVSAEMKQLIKMLLVTSFFIDRKAELLLESNSLKNRFIKLASFLYRPIALFRFRTGFKSFLIEYHLFKIMQNLLNRG